MIFFSIKPFFKNINKNFECELSTILMNASLRNDVHMMVGHIYGISIWVSSVGLRFSWPSPMSNESFIISAFTLYLLYIWTDT